jgi:hypothetical protein
VLSFIKKHFIFHDHMNERANSHTQLRRPLTRVLFLIMCAITTIAQGETKAYQEEQVHAVFLYNITQFISWPGSAFRNTNTPIKICLFGKTPVTGYLEKVTSGEKVKGRQIVVEAVDSIEKAVDCHILFLTSVTVRLHSDQLPMLKNKPILLISPSNNFAKNGGMLALEHADNRIKPIINLTSVKKAQISISSKLLRLATIIGDNSQ